MHLNYSTVVEETQDLKSLAAAEEQSSKLVKY